MRLCTVCCGRSRKQIKQLSKCTAQRGHRGRSRFGAMGDVQMPTAQKWCRKSYARPSRDVRRRGKSLFPVPRYCIYYRSVVVMTSKGILTTMPVSVCPARHRLYRAAPDHPHHLDRATAAPHVSPRCPTAKEWAPTPNSASGGQGKAPSRGRLALYPGRLRRIVKKWKS